MRFEAARLAEVARIDLNARLGPHRLSLFVAQQGEPTRTPERDTSALGWRAFTRLNREAIMREGMTPPKLVHVRAYVRTRLGRLEHVCEHTRSLPRQLSFGF